MQWLKPKLVCQVRFTEWTRDAHLRHADYLGLRTDKKPEDVVREHPSSGV
jgi:bifunctional non-homologous end joining protein LigD